MSHAGLGSVETDAVVCSHDSILVVPIESVNSGQLSFFADAADTLDMASLGQRVTTLREAAGLKPVELAERVGIKQPSLWAIENGKTKGLRGNTLLRLCEELHTTADFLLHGNAGEAGVALELSTMEAELVFTIRSLAPDRRVALMQYARYLITQEPGREAKNGTRQATPGNVESIRRKRKR